MTLRLVAGTIVAKNYIAYARVWARSFRAQHPDARVVVLLADRNAGEIDPAGEPFELLEAESLGIPGFREMAFRYDVMELSTAVKPAFLERLFRDGNDDVAMYFDPDILVLDSVTPVIDALQTANIVLTPHSLSPIPVDGRRPTEAVFLVSGAYNLGFIGVRRSPETMKMLAWWRERLVRGGASAPEKGLFTDQKWIDLVPSFFDGVEIFRDPTLNVAYWNLHERGEIAKVGDRFELNGLPLRFFHFSGFVPDQPEIVSKHQDRFRTEHLSPAARELFGIYGAAIRREGHDDARRMPYAYNAFDDGDPVVRPMRIAYQLAEANGLAWPDPFRVGPGTFRAWAVAPWGESLLAPFARVVWESRADLREAFPLGSHQQVTGFLDWLTGPGAREIGLGPATRSDLRSGNGPEAGEDAGPPPPEASSDRGTSPWGFLVDDPPLLPGERPGYEVPPGSALKKLAERVVGTAVYRRARFRYWCRMFQPTRLVSPLSIPRPSDHPSVAATAPAGPSSDVVITPVEAPLGVNLFGYLDTESGIAEVARRFVRMFEAAGVPVAPITVPQPWLRRGDHSITRTATTTPFPVNLFFVNADQLPQVIGSSRTILDGRRSVGYWFWELEQFPACFEPSLDLVDEVWVASSFCQKSIAARARIPVVCVPPTQDDTGWPGPDRARFGLSADDLVFISIFDAASVVRRKNPGAVIAAFKRAFPKPGREILLLKTANATDMQIAALERLARGVRVRIVNGYADREEILTMHASADACVSLHRSEGLGLTLLESMAYGKPVIATAYGGCTDFLRPDSAILIPYRRTRIGRTLGPYPADAVWAEPDVDAAVAAFRLVADDREAAARMGARARAVFKEWAAGAEIIAKHRIEALAASRSAID